jgi:hypothetical protein
MKKARRAERTKAKQKIASRLSLTWVKLELTSDTQHHRLKALETPPLVAVTPTIGPENNQPVVSITSLALYV